jgi:hypothetical protein
VDFGASWVAGPDVVGGGGDGDMGISSRIMLDPEEVIDRSSYDLLAIDRLETVPIASECWSPEAGFILLHDAGISQRARQFRFGPWQSEKMVLSGVRFICLLDNEFICHNLWFVVDPHDACAAPSFVNAALSFCPCESNRG